MQSTVHHEEGFSSRLFATDDSGDIDARVGRQETAQLEDNLALRLGGASKLTQDGNEILGKSGDVQFATFLGVRSAEPSAQIYGPAEQAGAGLDPADELQAVLYSGDHTGRIEALAACIDVNPLKFQGLGVGH